MRNWIFIVLVLFCTSLFSQDKWRGIYSSSIFSYSSKIYCKGFDLAYFRAGSKKIRYNYWELSDMVYGTYRYTNSNEKVIRIGIGFGLGYDIHSAISFIKFRFLHSAGLFYQKTNDIPLHSHLYERSIRRFGIYYKPRIQAEYAINSKISTFIGITGVIEVPTERRKVNNVFIDPRYRSYKNSIITIGLSGFEIGLQYKL